jgi:hypothetical protein
MAQSPIIEISPPDHNSAKFRWRRIRIIGRIIMAGPMPDLPPGYQSRPVRPEGDVESILELCTAAAMAEHGVSDVDERMIREAYNLPSFDAETDSILILDANGRAAAVTEFFDGDEVHVAPFLFLRVRPDLANSEVSTAALAWAAERAPANAHLAPAGARVAMHTDLSVVNRPMIEALERAGWRHERTNWTMEIDLAAAAPLPAPVWPEGISVRSADLERDTRAIHEVEGGLVQRPLRLCAAAVRAVVPLPNALLQGRAGAVDPGHGRREDRRHGALLVAASRPAGPGLDQHPRRAACMAPARAGAGHPAPCFPAACRSRHRPRRAGRRRAEPDRRNAPVREGRMRVVREHLEYELLVRDGRDLRTLSLEPS